MATRGAAIGWSSSAARSRPSFSKPDNPDGWPAEWPRADSRRLPPTSALNADRRVTTPADRRGSPPRLADAGVASVRSISVTRAGSPPHVALSLETFSRNFLYTPLGEAEFLEQNRAAASARPARTRPAGRGWRRTRRIPLRYSRRAAGAPRWKDRHHSSSRRSRLAKGAGARARQRACRRRASGRAAADSGVRFMP